MRKIKKYFQTDKIFFLNPKMICTNKDVLKTLRNVISWIVIIFIPLSLFSSCQANYSVTSGFQPDEILIPEKTIISFVNKEGQGSIVVNTNILNQKIDGEIISNQYDLYRTKMAALTSNGVLYLATTTEITKISDSVKEFILSSLGNGIAYINKDNMLYLYNCDEKSEAKLIGEVTANSTVISPDGKTVAYVHHDELFVYTNGTSLSVGKNLSSVAVANEGKHIYSFAGDSEDGKSLYYSSIGTAPLRLAAGIDDFNVYMFNRDLSQVMFRINDKFYLSTDGAKKQEIAFDQTNGGRKVRFWYPFMHQSSSLIKQTNKHSYFSSLISFSNQLFCNDTENGLVLLGEAGRVNQKLEGATDIFLCEGGDTLLYRKSGALYKSSSSDFSNPEKIADKVESYRTSPEGEMIYYTDVNGIIYSKNGQKKATLLAEHADTYVVTDKGTLFYLSYRVSDNCKLFVCEDGRKTIQIAENATSLEAYGDFVYYSVLRNPDTQNYGIYCSEGNTDFTLLADNIDREYILN